ncbi:MAG TPA: alpha/beta fold hydrolase [Solirubrobacteraceae bacterium]|nr:alpha/beta fold hydrolase [Solirubrobacteraceae bacterium]
MTEQEIRFCEAGGARVAYATVGSGPPLVLPATWVSHLEAEWAFPEVRRFIGALAREHTVVRYDRPGSGLSDRVGVEPPTVDGDVRTLAAVIDALGADAVALLGWSYGSCAAAVFAARHPERVVSLATVGGFAAGADAAPAALREAIVATVRAHWGAGSRMLADVWVPGVDTETRERFAAVQRAAADPETAAAVLEAIYATDVRDELGGVRAPTVVVHRRDDRAIPFALGRDLAARIPGARLVALDGEIHLPWFGDADAVLAALGRAPEPDPVADGPLSDRERQVLRLVADGLSDAEIAERLIVSPHTVHRHVANIRTKLRQPSRAAAAAHAVRNGLI